MKKLDAEKIKTIKIATFIALIVLGLFLFFGGIIFAITHHSETFTSFAIAGMVVSIIIWIIVYYFDNKIKKKSSKLIKALEENNI